MATFFVDIHGSDATASGTDPSTPFRSISAAFSAASGSDTIKISGEHKDTIVNTATPKTMTFEGFGRNQTIWNGDGKVTGNVIESTITTVHSMTVKNMHVKNIPITGNGIFMNSGSHNNPNNLTFVNVSSFNVSKLIRFGTKGTCTITDCDIDTFDSAVHLGNEGAGSQATGAIIINKCTWVNPISTGSICIEFKDVVSLGNTNEDRASITECVFPACFAYKDTNSTAAGSVVIYLLKSNFNTFDFTNGAKIRNDGSNSSTLSSWQSLSGLDGTSLDSIADVLDADAGLYGIDRNSALFTKGVNKDAIGGTGGSYGLSKGVAVGEGSGINRGIEWDVASHNSNNPTNLWVLNNIIQASGSLQFELSSSPSGQITTPVITFVKKRVFKSVAVAGNFKLDITSGSGVAFDLTNTIETSPKRNPVTYEFRTSAQDGAFAYNAAEAGDLTYTEFEVGEDVAGGSGVLSKHIQLRITMRDNYL